MVTADEFARVLVKFPNEAYGAAARRSLAQASGIDSTDRALTAIEALRRAAKREASARVGPSTFVAAAPGNGHALPPAFTYEDPILAAAARHVQDEAKAPGVTISDAGLFRWMLTGVHAFLTQFDEADRKALAGRIPKAPVGIGNAKMRIAIFGDGGYKSRPQEVVFELVKAASRERGRFDVVVHLGDTYYEGSEEQDRDNLIGPLGQLAAALGGVPTFSLCGNHDLYSGYRPYLGVLDQLRQPGRFFAIKNDVWKVLCIDTAFGSHTMLKDDGALDDPQQRWMSTELQGWDPNRTVLLSHHFTVSAWESPAKTLREQLPKLLGGPLAAWYWGHEHRMVAYDRSAAMLRGGCIGNAVFLEKWSPPKRAGSVAWSPPKGCTCIAGGRGYWPHGFLELELTGGDSPTLVERYLDEHGNCWERRL